MLLKNDQQGRDKAIELLRSGLVLSAHPEEYEDDRSEFIQPPRKGVRLRGTHIEAVRPLVLHLIKQARKEVDGLRFGTFQLPECGPGWYVYHESTDLVRFSVPADKTPSYIVGEDPFYDKSYGL
ncbi:hypothetical protein [Microvirga yunnanensis]|uniref:hypothetical protein n=1 Tax=Microvirga yunnanensis TaxID=2953740 RepID=UPI0021C88553|nr:hypothetical protein [Microvirga sp. HBU65207]